MNYSRPLDPSTSTNNSQQPKTREEKGKDKEATENNEEEEQGNISAEIKTPEPQLQCRKGDDDDGDEDEEEEEDEYIEVFQVLANIARMKVFGERMNNAEGGALSGGLGKAGWYHEVQYFGMRGSLERIAGDGVSNNGESFKEGESEGHGDMGKEEREEKGQVEEEKGEEKGEEEEKEREEEEEGKETEDDDEENYVIVTFLPLGEQADSDDKSCYFVEVTSSDEEEDSDDDEGSKDNKDTENNKDKKGNVNRSESNNTTNNNSKKGNKNDDLDSDNDEWHDLHHHCHHCQSFHNIIITQTTTTTNPQRQSPPQLQEQGRIPLVNPSFEILQSSPTSFTIQLAIPGAKRRDISVAYDLSTNVLTLSGVLYQSVLSVEDSSSTSSSTSSSLGSESGTDSKSRPDAGINQGSQLKSNPEYEADLDLCSAYERASRPGRVGSGSGSVLLFGGYGEEQGEEEEEEGKQGGGGGDGDISSTDTDDSNNKQSQTQTQTQTPPPTTTERIPIRQIIDQVNFVIFCSPTPTSECRLSPSFTPEEQEQHKEVNLGKIKARLKDGMPTVVVPLAVEEEVENESMVGIAL